MWCSVVACTGVGTARHVTRHMCGVTLPAIDISTCGLAKSHAGTSLDTQPVFIAQHNPCVQVVTANLHACLQVFPCSLTP